MVDEQALRNEVTPQLHPGEKLLWVGKPMPLRAMLAGGNLFGAVAAVLMVGFMLFFFNSVRFNFSMSRGASSEIFSLFNLFPLILIAFGLFTVAKPIYDFLMAGRTVYALTDQRALIIKPVLSGGRKVESYTETEGIERHDIADGKGDLVFQREMSIYYSNRRRRVRSRKIGFFGIPNVQQVEAMMLRTFDEGV
jgi:hypothetical protein